MEGFFFFRKIRGTRYFDKIFNILTLAACETKHTFFFFFNTRFEYSYFFRMQIWSILFQ